MPTFDVSACVALIEPLSAISMSAATAIRAAQNPGDVRIKADGSPVTTADMASETLIREGLARLAPDLPIVSEEHAGRASAPVRGGNYFLVDPLDGTREFIAGRDEYTTNIALMADGVPILGVITAPALNLLWRGMVGRGAERLEFPAKHGAKPVPIHSRARPQDELVVMVSRSHMDPATNAYLAGLSHGRRIACGSSVKFCRLAEGSADLYPRLAPTHDWDVAAGHALLAAAGGGVTAPDGSALVYGSAERLIPAFLARGAPEPAVRD